MRMRVVGHPPGNCPSGCAIAARLLDPPPVPKSEGPGGTLSKVESLSRSGPPAQSTPYPLTYFLGGADPSDNGLTTFQADQVSQIDRSKASTGTPPAPNQAPQPSPDPNLPVNQNYVMALENDAGKDPTPALPLEGRALEYMIHTAPTAANPNGKPLSADQTKDLTITEHLNPPLPGGTKTTSSTPGTGQFPDIQGRNGDRKDSGVFTTTRYFTATSGKQNLGVIPFLDATGRHNADTIKINMSTGEVNLNGHTGPIDPP
jgi:hypothetical protein